MIKAKTKFDASKVVNELITPVFKFKKPKDDIDKAIQCFLKGNTGKFGRYLACENALVYRVIVTSNRGENVECNTNVIAIRLDKESGSLFIGNSSILPLIGRSVAYGNESLNRGVTDVQQRISTHIQMIPFTVFTQAGLDLNKIEILERGPAETVTRKVLNPKYDSSEPAKMKKNNIKMWLIETVHYTGASLFKVEERVFLFDIDRREIDHKVFNPFLAGIPAPVETIADAYQALKPKEVVEAEKNGVDIKRQGEWFFIRVKNQTGLSPDKTPQEDREWLPEFRPMTLQAGDNSPNTAQLGVQAKGYCKGKISHDGREHADLILKHWYIAIPNTATESFTITGDVD